MLVFIVGIGAIILPYYDYYYLQTSQSSVMGDFNVLGLSLSGTIDVEYATGHQFTFIGNRFNISIPCEFIYPFTTSDERQ